MRILPEREIFGDPSCPLMYRWKLVGGEDGKIMLHWFLPSRREQDCHDHPRDFLTVVLWGSYRDTRRDGKVDVVKAPTIRWRSADHAHVTEAGPHGCLTVAWFGHRKRKWGFWRNDEWIPWRLYEDVFGSRFRCDSSADGPLDRDEEVALIARSEH